MMGGSVRDASTASTPVEVYRSAEGVLNSSKQFATLIDGASKATYDTGTASLGKLKANSIKWLNLTQGTRGAIAFDDTSDPLTLTELNTKIADISGFVAGDKIRVFWVEERLSTTTNKDAFEITINASTFPGTYKVVGDTFIRSANTGADSAFQFIIPKAKVSSDVTITLEAEGDPSTNLIAA